MAPSGGLPCKPENRKQLNFYFKILFLEKIFDTCATIKKLRINQFGKNGAKKTAMYANAIKSSVKDLAELIKIYNSEFKCNLTDNDVFSQCSSDRLESGLATEIR